MKYLSTTTVAVFFFKKTQTNSKRKLLPRQNNQISLSNIQHLKKRTLMKNSDESLPKTLSHSPNPDIWLCLLQTKQSKHLPSCKMFPSSVSGNGFKCHILDGTLCMYLYMDISCMFSHRRVGSCNLEQPLSLQCLFSEYCYL